MRRKKHSRLLFLLLFLALALSYLWCIVDNILTSVERADAGVVMPVTAVTITIGVLWLIAHGMHGAASFVLPALFLWPILQEE